MKKSSEESEGKKKKKSTLGDFFGVDLYAVEKACALGMNPAVAYLVLACFTGKTNRFTPASTNAVEKYTALGRKRASEAIEALQVAELIRRVPRDGERPRYELLSAPPAPPPPSVKALEYRKEQLSPVQREAFEMVERGEKLRGKWSAAAKVAKRKGWLDQLSYSGPFIVRPPPPPPPETKPKMVWLPNELVTSAANESSPVERIRKTSDPLALQLLVELYSEQSLTDDGGIDRRTIWHSFSSELLGTVPPYNVWAFSKREQRCRGTLIPAYKASDPTRNAWDGILLLEALGLIQWRLQLFDASDGALMYPLGTMNPGELIKPSDAVWRENEIGHAARGAGEALANHLGKQPPQGAIVVPVGKEIPKPALIGIARLRYRPKITDTSKWFRQLVEKRDKWVEGFTELHQRALRSMKKAVNS